VNPDVAADLQRRLVALERTAVRFRLGEVDDTGPLDVKLGGSDVPYEDVRSVQPVETGQIVAALMFGNDLIVLGPVSDGDPTEARGQASVNGTGSPTVDLVVNDGLPASGKRAIAGWDAANSVFAADFVNIAALSYGSGTTTFRLSTKGGGNITSGQAVAINYMIWND